MEIRNDILGRRPEIGDTIVFNPPHYKGLVYGICVGFKKGSGLPIIGDLSENYFGTDEDEAGNEYYTPKTGFVIAINV